MKEIFIGPLQQYRKNKSGPKVTYLYGNLKKYKIISRSSGRLWVDRYN